MDHHYTCPVCYKDVTINDPPVDPYNLLGHIVECQSCHAELLVESDSTGIRLASRNDQYGVLSPKTLILEDRLLHSTPDTVYAWLQDRSSQDDDYDEKIEIPLLERGEPLINLGIARYGYNTGVMAHLWMCTEQQPDKHTGHTRALRLSILSNQRLDPSWAHPTVILGGEEEFRHWLQHAPDEEIVALWENPSLGTFLLQELYEKTGAFGALEDARWRQIIKATLVNPRLRKWDLHDFDLDYGTRSLRHAIYKLPSIVPVTKEWAYTLARLLELTPPTGDYQYAKADIDATIGRWRTQVTEEDFDNPELKLRIYYGRLYFGWVTDKNSLEEMLASDDLAMRCAAYAFLPLSVEQINAGVDRDKKDFIEWAFKNERLYRGRGSREALLEAARKVDYAEHEVRNSKSDLLGEAVDDIREKYPDWFKDWCSVSYWRDRIGEECDRIRKEYPDWFLDESPSESPLVQPELIAVHDKLQMLGKSVGVIRIIVIALLITTLWKAFFG